ncbi:hypothetical protein NQZ68_041621 [Dissostichus eleginoides]|nr:hypothetical protein NQZ68_041621 [Dissostichus eleginoides]
MIRRSSAEASIYTNMSVNSSYFDDPLDSPSSDSSSHSQNPCSGYTTSVYVFSAATILYTLLLLPLIIFVLYLGFQKSRKPRSSSTATSHSDHFTYHSIFMQLNELLGLNISFISICLKNQVMFDVGQSLLNYTTAGKALFHLLTCVERYLAVVHPITYLGLRQGGGVSISVLYVLKRPGPGEGGWTRERVDQSKQRAFYTLMAIMGVLLLRFGANLIIYAMSGSTAPHPSTALFHLLTCVERYLAVVHPITYLGLRQGGGVRIRNISIGISVLYVLKRPGPGEVGGNRKRVDQSKQRAFYTILSITGVILLRFGGNLISSLHQ